MSITLQLSPSRSSTVQIFFMQPAETTLDSGALPWVPGTCSVEANLAYTCQGSALAKVFNAVVVRVAGIPKPLTVGV